jgi:hypothetical protein
MTPIGMRASGIRNDRTGPAARDLDSTVVEPDLVPAPAPVTRPVPATGLVLSFAPPRRNSRGSIELRAARRCGTLIAIFD